jgi:hypothetical protein
VYATTNVTAAVAVTAADRPTSLPEIFTTPPEHPIVSKID